MASQPRRPLPFSERSRVCWSRSHIGALGAIDDVSVTQAPTIWEIRDADPRIAPGPLFFAGMRVGRDHVGSIVNTLAMADVGASLPLLIVFSLSGLSFERAIASEVVATEVARALIGSIGLVAAVPITTWLAARAVAGRTKKHAVRRRSTLWDEAW